MCKVKVALLHIGNACEEVIKNKMFHGKLATLVSNDCSVRYYGMFVHVALLQQVNNL